MRTQELTAGAKTPAREAARALLLTAGFAALSTLCALIRLRLPGTEVPFTMQVYAVLVAGLAGGRMLGPASQALYLLAGAAGLPVFAAAGPGLHGPTCGYLVGFVAGAALAGHLAGRGRAGLGRLLAAALSGVAVIYLLGWLNLMAWGLGPGTAFRAGVLPFIPVDAAKAFLAAATAKTLRKWC